MSLCSNLKNKGFYNIKLLCSPESKHHSELLTENKIIVKSKPKYQFKVFLREKHFNNFSRQQVNDYLESLGDLVYFNDSHLTEITDDDNNKYYFLSSTNIYGKVENA